MNRIYWRVTYNGIGIYEAFKTELWNKLDNPNIVWNDLKNSNVFNWLKVPSVHYDNCYSYFTKEGMDLFMKNTYPVFVKYLDENKIKIDSSTFEKEELKILYEDEHQIVVTNLIV